MKNVLLHPAYFPSVQFYAVLVGETRPIFEVCDNFQKQTHRTRCHIATANGLQMLNVPIKHLGKGQHKLTRETLVDYDTVDWRKQHLKAFETAYRSSPFFEFYEDDIRAIFDAKPKFLIDLNVATHHFVMDALQMPVTEKIHLTKTYEKTPKTKDFRGLITAKKPLQIFKQTPYRQIFSDKNGFIANLSILDLLFMQGSSAIIYLKGLLPL